jgi:hypothetical protein
MFKPAEIFSYAIVAASSLVIMGFVVHMLVGGLVSEQTEQTLIILVCSADAVAIGYMARDVIRRRRGY